MRRQKMNELEVEFHVIVLENVSVFLWLALSWKRAKYKEAGGH